MLNNNGSAGFIVLIVIIVLIGAGVYVVMEVPAAQPVKEYIATIFPSIAGTEPIDETIPQMPGKQPAFPPLNEQQASTPPVGTQPGQTTEQQTGTPPVSGSLVEPQPGGFPIAGILNPFGIGSAQSSDTTKAVQDKTNNSPVAILQACMTKLKSRDIIGAETFVSENGRKYTMNGMSGVHKLLLKNVIDTKAFDEIGYADIKVNGQTAWVPLYSNLDAKNKIVSLYIILANRGDGWRVDDLYDPRR
ncbi:MAG: hypothetical protein ACYC0V_09910 [Armatimonadota bacterium]